MFSLKAMKTVKQETQEAKIIESCDDLRFDGASRKLLASKSLLARILKDCTAEYKDCNPADIEQLIGETRVGSVAVEEDLTGITFNMVGNEHITLTEGKVIFDIYCLAKLPGSDKKAGLIINVESQKSFYTSYPLVRRAVYYTARMLSSQKAILGVGTDYGDLYKVYSIWICTDPPKHKQNSIEEYKIEKTIVYGKQNSIQDNQSVSSKFKPYDLQHIVFVNLGSDNKEDSPVILKLLGILLSPETTLKQKKDICIKYDIPITKEIEQGIKDMCCVLDRVRETVLEKSIRAVMSSLNCTVDKALDILQISGCEGERLYKKLNSDNNLKSPLNDIDSI